MALSIPFFETNLLILAGALAIGSPVRAEPPTQYRSILEAFESGKQIRVLTDLAICKTADGITAGPPVRGGLLVTAFNILPDGHIVFSDLHHFLDGANRPAEEFLRYDVNQSGNATLSVTHLVNGNFIRKDEFLCAIPDGMRFIW